MSGLGLWTCLSYHLRANAPAGSGVMVIVVVVVRKGRGFFIGRNYISRTADCQAART